MQIANITEKIYVAFVLREDHPVKVINDYANTPQSFAFPTN